MKKTWVIQITINGKDHLAKNSAEAMKIARWKTSKELLAAAFTVAEKGAVIAYEEPRIFGHNKIRVEKVWVW